jgi:hypothetical protein
MTVVRTSYPRCHAVEEVQSGRHEASSKQDSGNYDSMLRYLSAKATAMTYSLLLSRTLAYVLVASQAMFLRVEEVVIAGGGVEWSRACSMRLRCSIPFSSCKFARRRAGKSAPATAARKTDAVRQANAV